MIELSTLGYILVFTFLGSVGALVGGLVLLSQKKIALKVSHFLASFAAGTLLGTAFLDLLPEAVHESEGTEINIFFWALFGIVFFFLIERSIHWFHNHESFHEHHSGHAHAEESKTTIPLIIISDTMHNFLDGVVIALTFMVSIPLGIVTTFAVMAHEIPQEIGDFGLLLHKGMSRGKIIWVNILSACAAFVGAILAYTFGEAIEGTLPIFLAVTAGFFIYIASSDLIPEIHHEKRKGFALIESMLLLLGIAVIFTAVTLLGHAE